MDKVHIDLGGHHLLGDDILKVQENCQSPLLSYALATGETFIALAGVLVSIGGGSINWTSGWIYINGEICKVDAGSAAYPANTTFQIVQTVDTAGTQVYENTVSVDTYLVRKATISGNAGGANTYSNLKHFKDWLCGDAIPAITMLAYLGGNWFINTIDLYITKTKNGENLFNGKLEVTSYASGTDTVALTLPPPYRPGDIFTVLAPALVNGTKTFLHVVVSSTGTITPLGITNGQNVILIMDGIRYPY